MAKENKVRIYNRLFFKLYLNFAVMLLVTAVLICIIFIRLYEDTTMKNSQNQLEKQAMNISSRMTEFIYTRKYDDFFNFISILEEISELDVWTISNPFAMLPMNENLETADSYEEMAEKSEAHGSMLKSVFQGKPKVHQQFYDDISEVWMITTAVPIYGVNREVVGAVLLKYEVEELNDIISKSLSIIVFSSFLALAISFIIIILFATGLSLPISRMRFTALALAAGNFRSKTGIKRNDELGDLAKTFDILSDKLLENDIQRKNLEQMRLDFFANVSHELRTPITVIRAYTETLADGVVYDKEKVNQYYDRMLSECKSMERLVGDLMTLSKMQNPDFTIEMEPVNLVHVFDDIIRSAYAIAEKKNISIVVNKDASIYMMLGDYDRLRQMFMVILDNAIKFSEERKTVHINLSKADTIRVSIRDEGIGIDQIDIDNIFEKFYKSNLRQNASGTGLGLAIAKQIALRHNGSIEVVSVPGRGSEFIFTFPIAQEVY